MISPKSLKHKITQVVLDNLPSQYRIELEKDVDSIIVEFWTTGRQEGLRLTSIGQKYFELAEIEHYDFSLTNDIQKYSDNDWNKFLLDCSKKIKCPYYFGIKKNDIIKRMGYIRFYDSKIAMLVEIYGSLSEYLNSIKESK